MRRFLRKFWHDERGYVLMTEWFFVASILTLGAIAGVLAMQHVDEDTFNWPAALTR